jgi:hypothetical protein
LTIHPKIYSEINEEVEVVAEMIDKAKQVEKEIEKVKMVPHVTSAKKKVISFGIVRNTNQQNYPFATIMNPT